MKTPSLASALAKKEPIQVPAEIEAAIRPTAKAKDGRIVTTVRIEPALLEALKIVAAKKRVKVNDLLLEGAAHVVALNDQKQ